MLISFRLEIVLMLTQDTCTVCAKRTMGLEIILDPPIVLLGDEAQVDALFSLFGDSVNLNAREVHTLRRTLHKLRNRFGRTRYHY
jgi:hypothetical protein